MDVILDRGSTPLTSRKTKGSQREPFVFVIPALVYLSFPPEPVLPALSLIEVSAVEVSGNLL